MRVTALLGLLAVLAVSLCGNTEEAIEKEPTSQVGRPVVKFPAEGGTGRVTFDDLKGIDSTVFSIHSIAITSGDQVDSIQITYLLKSGSLYKAPRHGGGSNHPFVITLAADEYVTKVEGTTSGTLINQLIITTNRPNNFLMKTYGPFGEVPGSKNFTLTENFVVGFLGSSSDHLNSIGVYALAPINKSDIYGSFNKNFREYPDTNFPPAVKISEIHVYHGWKMNAIHFEYELYGGGKRMGKMFGQTKDNLTTIQFGPDEELIGVKGEVSYAGTFSVLYQLTFISQNKKNAKLTAHGPFGPDGDDSFSFNGHILGCEGASSDVVNTIRFYYY